MRKISNLHDAQIVLNDLLDWRSLQDSKPRDQHGLQIKNAGAGTEDSDLVTFGQLKSAIPLGSQKATSLSPAQSSQILPKSTSNLTFVWSVQGSFPSGFLPAYALMNRNFIYTPVSMWVSLVNAATPAFSLILNIHIGQDMFTIGSAPFIFSPGNLTAIVGAHFASTLLPNQPPITALTFFMPQIFITSNATICTLGLDFNVVAV